MAGWEVKVDQTGSDGMKALTCARENTVSPVVVKHPQYRVTAVLARTLDAIQTLTSLVDCL